MKKIVYLLLFPWILNAQSSPKSDEYRPIPFTQKDRDILISLNERVNFLEQEVKEMKNEIKKINEVEIKKINERMITKEEMKEEMRDLRSLIMWIGSISIGLVTALIGFILWDRRTLVKPLEKEVQYLKFKSDDYDKHIEKSERFWKAIIELSQTNEQLKSILKQHHIL